MHFVNVAATILAVASNSGLAIAVPPQPHKITKNVDCAEIIDKCDVLKAWKSSNHVSPRDGPGAGAPAKPSTHDPEYVAGLWRKIEVLLDKALQHPGHSSHGQHELSDHLNGTEIIELIRKKYPGDHDDLAYLTRVDDFVHLPNICYETPIVPLLDCFLERNQKAANLSPPKTGGQMTGEPKIHDKSGVSS